MNDGAVPMSFGVGISKVSFLIGVSGATSDSGRSGIDTNSSVDDSSDDNETSVASADRVRSRL